MAQNMYGNQDEKRQQDEQAHISNLKPPDYTVSPCKAADHMVNLLLGFAVGFVVLYIFYKIILLSVAGGVIAGIVNIFLGQRRAIQKRLKNLRLQFYDMLEAMSVSMRAGRPAVNAMADAREELRLVYPLESDIITELDILLLRHSQNAGMSDGLKDFAERCGLEDVASFASVYAAIDGKSSRADEIVRETEQVISEKMAVEMEIETLMTSSKTEVNIMLVMPLLILLLIGYAGAGFMDMIYHNGPGRVVATVGLIIFIVSYFIARRFSEITV